MLSDSSLGSSNKLMAAMASLAVAALTGAVATVVAGGFDLLSTLAAAVAVSADSKDVISASTLAFSADLAGGEPSGLEATGDELLAAAGATDF